MDVGVDRGVLVAVAVGSNVAVAVGGRAVAEGAGRVGVGEPIEGPHAAASRPRARRIRMELDRLGCIVTCGGEWESVLHLGF